MNTPYAEAEFVVFGVPLDMTATYFPGARFGPESIRRASLNIETFDFESGFDVKKIKIIDIGDIDVDYSSINETLVKISKVSSEILSDSKKPLILGGEHTLTLGACRAFKKTVLICFDAHLDLREEYAGAKLSHATFMRRLVEEENVDRIIFVGTRAISSEESEFIRGKTNIRVITAKEACKNGLEPTLKLIKNEINNYQNIYVSIDMDVFDPFLSPSVGNPEPGGLTYDLVSGVIESLEKNIIGADVTEVAPIYNIDITSIYAAKLLFKIIKAMKNIKSRKRR